MDNVGISKPVVSSHETYRRRCLGMRMYGLSLHFHAHLFISKNFPGIKNAIVVRYYMYSTRL